MRRLRRLAVILCTFWLSLAILPAVARAADSTPRPNFIFFLTDDQRADALSIAGNKVLKTPNIDQLARDGVRFTNAFVTTSLCAPSRASFLTGQWAHTHGVRTNEPSSRLKPTQTIFADLLRENGYEVAFIGKWHMDGAGRDREWDYYFGFEGQGRYKHPIIAENGGPDRRYWKRYTDDMLATKAIEFIRRPRAKPFCLFVFFKAPHRSWIRAPRHKKLFEGIAVPEPDTLHTDYAGKPNAFKNADMKIGDFDDVASFQKFAKDYYAVITAVDENVGRVMKAVADEKLVDDTAVIFSSDNGFFVGEWNFFDKRLMHEPSIRIPMIIRYPRSSKPGTTRKEMVLNVDVAPTLLDLAGVSVPDWMQGKSMRSLLEGREAEWRDAWLYESYEYPAVHMVPKNRGVRTERWKYIHYFEDPQEYELYDLVADPDEKKNLYGDPEFAPIVEELRQRMTQLRRETGDPDLKQAVSTRSGASSNP
ncbi:MAG: sulfatase [Deltaproteobacteria bacterium]|jgi:arylsulfatase A-like enzyme|nr:sulfatase [Deltaproteobacteria bacterium]